MKKLLAAFEKVRSKGHDQLLRVTRFELKESGLDVRLSGSGLGAWDIECKGVRRFQVVYEWPWTEFLSVSQSHPVLWEDVAPRGVLSFHGPVKNPGELLLRLFNAHGRVTEGCIPVERYFSSSMPLVDLLGGGFGEVATGPVPVLEEYKRELIGYGVKASIMVTQRPSPTELQALLVGRSYVVAERFAATEFDSRST
jgi:hypothetical protein